MEVGMIGLGKMGAGMTLRWIRNGIRVVGHDINSNVVDDMAQQGMEAAYSVDELVSKLAPPRAVWLMLPAGGVTEQMVHTVADRMEPGDAIVDGGNTFYKDDLRRAEALMEQRIYYLDQGTSGGIWGLEQGYCLMVGGHETIVKQLEPAFLALAPENGYVHTGPVGSGHFVKMVHNGIEYGMMQAYAEGFHIMQAKSEFQLNLAEIAEVWRHGSVVRSWLLDLAAAALVGDPHLDSLQGFVNDSGEGRWTIKEAIDLDVPAPVITASLFERFHSRQTNIFAAKMLAALRAGFGGHAVVKADTQAAAEVVKAVTNG